MKELVLTEYDLDKKMRIKFNVSNCAIERMLLIEYKDKQ